MRFRIDGGASGRNEQGRLPHHLGDRTREFSGSPEPLLGIVHENAPGLHKNSEKKSKDAMGERLFLTSSA